MRCPLYCRKAEVRAVLTGRTTISWREWAAEQLLEIYFQVIVQSVSSQVTDKTEQKERTQEIFCFLVTHLPSRQEFESSLLSRPSTARRLSRQIAKRIGVQIPSQLFLSPNHTINEEVETGFALSPSLDCKEEAFWTQTLQKMRAMIVAQHALKRQRGSVWTLWSLVAVILLSCGLLAYGLSGSSIENIKNYGFPTPHEHQPLDWTTYQASPLETIGVYTLPDGMNSTVLSQALVVQNKFVVPVLQTPVDNWPRLNISMYELAKTGEVLSNSNRQSQFNIDLLPPDSKQTVSKSIGIDWKIHSWKLFSTGYWLVAIVNWSHSITHSQVTQVYLANIESQQSSLVKSYPMDIQHPLQYVFAVGHHQLLIQSEMQVTGSGQASLSLPIELYQLQGENPLTALSQKKILSGSFGWIQSPLIDEDGIYFTGTDQTLQAAHPKKSQSWGKLSYQGQLILFSAPQDALSAHQIYLSEDTLGKAWWIGTYSASKSADTTWQVKMARVESVQAGEVPTVFSLNGQVEMFQVHGRDLIWLQSIHHETACVVAELRGLEVKS